MFMIDLPLDAAALVRFAHRQGHTGGMQHTDEDFGYAVHAWLAATLGDQAPTPFRLHENRAGLRLLGYSRNDLTALLAHAREFALPDALAVCDWAQAADKAMPAAWRNGRRLGFEVRTCPVVRGERERDAYLIEVERAKAASETPISREEIYARWLTRLLERDGAARVVTGSLSLVGFRRVRVLRQAHAQRPRRQSVERPDALMTGELEVGDSERFLHLLARGVGRHRTFGFGMLLLRPASSGAQG